MLIGGKTIDMEERFGSVALDIIGKWGVQAAVRGGCFKMF